MTNEDLKKIIARIENLEKAILGDSGKNATKKNQSKVRSPDIDFSINVRAFAKRHATDKSGPKKFTLLLAYLTKGEIDKNIELSEIKRHWDKMSAKKLLGKFNRFYANEAKTKGWVDSKEYGTYCLTSEWKDVL